MGKVRVVGKLLGLDQGAPPPPAAPTALPQRDDPEIGQARKRQQEADRLRKGRRASILTSSRGVEGGLGSVNRPGARAAQLLGE